MATSLITPTPDQVQQTMSQPAPAPDASQAASQGKPSFWKSILAGALQGLAGSRGATSFGGGLGAGAAGEMQAQQQAQQNQLAQDQSARADQAQKNADEEHQVRMAQMQLQNRQISNQLHALDPHDPQFVQQTVQNLAKDADQHISAGASIVTPEFSSAAEAEKYIQENHLSKDYQVLTRPYHNGDGKLVYGGILYSDAPTTKDITQTYLDAAGKEVTAIIPKGSTNLSKVGQLNTAAAQQNVNATFKKKDQELKDQGTQIENDAQLLASGKMAPSQIPAKGGARDKAIFRANEIAKANGQADGYNAMQAESNFKAGQALDKAFTSGKEAQNLTAFNTASDHLAQLDGLVDGLGNTSSPAFNAASQAFAKATGSAAPTDFETVRNAAVAEVAKVFSGSNTTESEKQEIMAPFRTANSPAQLKGAIAQLRNLMASKKQALQNQYSQGKSGNPAFTSAHEQSSASFDFSKFPAVKQ